MTSAPCLVTSQIAVVLADSWRPDLTDGDHLDIAAVQALPHSGGTEAMQQLLIGLYTGSPVALTQLDRLDHPTRRLLIDHLALLVQVPDTAPYRETLTRASTELHDELAQAREDLRASQRTRDAALRILGCPSRTAERRHH